MTPVLANVKQVFADLVTLHFRNVSSYSEPLGIASGIKATDFRWNLCYAGELDARMCSWDASVERLNVRIIARQKVYRLTNRRRASANSNYGNLPLDNRILM